MKWTCNKSKRKVTQNNWKLIQKLFQNFKSSSNSFHEFSQLSKIEKKIKNKFYSSYEELAKDARENFSQYFISYYNVPEKYSKILQLSESFEATFKDYNNKIFLKESKNILEIKKRLNKLKKELREANSANASLIHVTPTPNHNKNNLRKFKLTIAKNISLLTSEQKKGMISIISNNYLDKNDDEVEFDINKMSFNQLKQIEKYVSKCNGENSSTLNGTSTDMISQGSDEKIVRTESNIIVDDDLSDSLSSSSNDSME